MSRQSGSVALVAILGLPVLSTSAQQLDAEQVPAIQSQGSLQIERSSASTQDVLRVDQPSQTATDICDTVGALPTYNGGCGSIELSGQPARDAAAISPVKVTDDGVFMRIEPQEDDAYDPDEIARRLGSDQPVDPEEFGTGGVAIQTLDSLIDVGPPPEDAPVLIEEVEPLLSDLPIK